MSLLFDDLSRAIASPVSRRKMLGMVGSAFGGAMLAALGLPSAAFGQENSEKCPKGTTPCHGKCCEPGLICCAGKCCLSKKAKCMTSYCCESGIVCASKCCEPNEICDRGQCRRMISPNQP